MIKMARSGKVAPMALVFAGTFMFASSSVECGGATAEASRAASALMDSQNSDRQDVNLSETSAQPEPVTQTEVPSPPPARSNTNEPEQTVPDQRVPVAVKEPPQKASTVKKAATNLTWHLDFNKAFSMARKENKLLLLMFSASDRCGSSKYIEQDMLRRERVKTWLASYYVCAKTNPDIPYGKVLRQRYPQGRGVPTIIVIDGKGRALGALSGCNTTSEKFMAQIANISRGLPPGYGN
ncbi:MAG: thioredoxin family protein [Candidatus Obscuribacterales bacterium]|nr:thioredoxin family protein [Candidatus Obscuribacterales bacterium]